MTEWVEPLLSNAIVATFLALLIGVVALFRPRPAVLHALWLIVLLKFITPPLIRFELMSQAMRSIRWPMSRALVPTSPASSGASGAADNCFADTGTSVDLFGGRGRDADDSVGSATPNGQPVDSASGELTGFPQLSRTNWLPAGVMAGWAAGSTVWFLGAGVRLMRFRRQVGRARAADGSLQETADEIAERLGLSVRPIVRVTDATLSPMLITVRRRGVVLLPTELLRGLAPSQQAAIIAHELAHLRRGDHWVRWLEFIVVGVYWWHPVAWLARHELQRAEESCCDAWVLSLFPDHGRGYAQALMATVDFLSEVRTPAPAGASGFGRVHSLQRRLEMILKRRWRPDLSAAARMTLVVIALGVLPWAPRAFSQTEPPREGTDKVALEPEPPALPTAAVEPATPLQRPGRAVAPLPEIAGHGSIPLPEDSGPTVFDPTAQATRRPTTEERLDRLEAMLNQLLAEVKHPQAQRPVEGTPNTLRLRPPVSSTTVGQIGVTGRGGSGAPAATRIGSTPAARTSPTEPLRSLGERRAERIAASADVKAKLVELDFEIQSLELQLRRAHAQRELLQKQIRDTKDGESAQPGPTNEERKAVPRPEQPPAS